MYFATPSWSCVAHADESLLPECMLKHDLCVRSMPVAMFLAMEYRVCMHVPRIIASHIISGPYDHIPPEHLGSPLF